MNKTLSCAAAVAMLLAAGLTMPALAQTGKLSGSELERYGRQLPDVAKRARAGAFRSYLASLNAAKAPLAVANAVRVATDLGTVTNDTDAFAWYTVSAMSDIPRVPQVYPEDGKIAGELRIVAAKDEFEPASFVLFPFQDMEKVTLKISALTGAGKAVFPAADLDLKVVKVWYQNGNGWFSYFDDPGLKLVPELLLNDETLVKVDTVTTANYARVDYPDGSKLVWISPPKHLETQTFRSAQEPFADAKALQPVALKAGEFKQFFLTANVPKTAAEGVYRGSIEVSVGGKKLADLPVALRVLPFVLPPPATFFDLDRDFLISVMGGFTLDTFLRLNGGDLALAKQQREGVLRDLRRHGILHPSDLDQDAETVALVKSLGFSTKPWFGKGFVPWFGKNFGGRMTFDEYMLSKAGAVKSRDFYTGLVGHTDVILGHGDEQGTAFVATHRNLFKYYHDYGLKIGCAGHDALLYKGGYTYSVHPFGGFPDDVEKIRPWNIIGDRWVGFYAGQHVGVENPAFVRRQNGMLSYLSECSILYNYEFAYGSWNDRANETYKPMVLAYLTRGGLVDTLAWEGFREGVDDMRYATKLMQLARQAIASGNTERMLEGRKARQYMAMFDGASRDLNEARAEMINTIAKLSRASAQ